MVDPAGAAGQTQPQVERQLILGHTTIATSCQGFEIEAAPRPFLSRPKYVTGVGGGGGVCAKNGR